VSLKRLEFTDRLRDYNFFDGDCQPCIHDTTECPSFGSRKHSKNLFFPLKINTHILTSFSQLRNIVKVISYKSTAEIKFILSPTFYSRLVTKSVQITLGSIGYFVSRSGISELGCATTKTDTAERSISIGTKSLQVCLCARCHGVRAGFTVDRE
jgi:hypothetical protein